MIALLGLIDFFSWQIWSGFSYCLALFWTQIWFLGECYENLRLDFCWDIVHRFLMASQDLIEVKFRLSDGTDIGPSKYSPTASVASLKEKILSQWPKGSIFYLYLFCFLLSFFFPHLTSMTSCFMPLGFFRLKVFQLLCYCCFFILWCVCVIVNFIEREWWLGWFGEKFWDLIRTSHCTLFHIWWYSSRFLLCRPC